MRFLTYNIKHAYSYLKKNAPYSLLTIIGLTVGLTVFLLVALFVYNEETVDYNIPNHNRIYRLYDAGKQDAGIAYELKKIISQDYPEVEANCVYQRYGDLPMIFRTKENSVRLNTGITTDNSFFKMFHIPVIKQMGEKPFSEKKSIVLTQAVAKKIFGDKNPLGQMINIGNFINVKVTAIIKGFPKNTSIAGEYLLNSANKNARMAMVCNGGVCYNPMTQLLLLKKSVNEKEFLKHFNQTIQQYQKRVKTFGLQPLTDIYLSKPMKENNNRLGNPSYLRIISIIGLIILILSVMNYLNFSLSLQHSKIKEVSIKKINGANNFQLFFYYLAESLIVMVISTLLSILLVFALRNYFGSLFGEKLNMNILKEPLFIAIYLSVVVVILLMNSIIPIYSLLKINIIDGLSNTIVRKNKSSIRTLFTTTQFVVSIALLISVFIIQKQLHYVETKDLGFSKQHLLKIDIPYGFKHGPALQSGINNLSFVSASSYSNGCPGSINFSLGSGEKNVDLSIQTMLVDTSFLKTFQIKILKGRNFGPGDIQRACMFNETAIKALGWGDLKNRKYKMFKTGGFDVVGIVNNFKVSSLFKEQQPVCLICGFVSGNQPNTLSVRVMPGNTVQQIAQLRKVWTSLSNDPFSFDFYDAFFNAKYHKTMQLSRSITIIAIIAIILTLIGILGQVIQSCTYRTKEIGIRKVNGATIIEIVNMLNLDFIKWLLVAFIIATPLAWYTMNTWLENFAYKTTLSWWVFLLAGLVVLFVTFVTVSWQTFIAARKNPVESLRYE